MNLNELYQQYVGNPTEDNLTPFFIALRKFSRTIGREMFFHNREVSDEWIDVCEDAATDIVVEISKYEKRDGISFAAWAKTRIVHDLLDWRKAEERQLEALDDPDKAIDVADPSPLPDQKAYYQEVLSKLTEEERGLFDMKAAGMTIQEMAHELGVSKSYVDKKWSSIVQTLQELHHSKPKHRL